MSATERDPKHDPPQDHERQRQFGNLVLLVVFVVLIGGGIWLVDALLDLRKAQECVGTGRRNCGTPIDVPVRER